MTPGMVPNVLVIPRRNPAYLQGEETEVHLLLFESRGVSEPPESAAFRRDAPWSDVDLVDEDTRGGDPSHGRGEREEGDGEDVVAAGVTHRHQEAGGQHQTCRETRWMLKKLNQQQREK